ncbi:MAG TPA: hypothetical protein VHA14_01295 [Bryobacteraceae bacterium]|nr:hypothetical protein [Bryobacteraceae bacterium]
MRADAEGFALLRAALDTAGIRFAVGGSWASAAFGEPRFTRDVDILAEFTAESLDVFLCALPESFFVSRDDAHQALRLGRPFNLIYMPSAFKFDLFPSSGYPLGSEELDRAIVLSETGLSAAAAPFVTPEDILLAKLHWYRAGGEVSEVQWRDIAGIVRTRGRSLDRNYLTTAAEKLSDGDLLAKVLD